MRNSKHYDPPRLPEESILELEDYLAMQRAVSERTRYRIVAELLREGETSATELAESLDIPSNKLHYHLDTLVDVGVIANRKQKEAVPMVSIRITSLRPSVKP
ncbi:helix-turn-helix domain-containing protein [Haladaptatus sp. CMAA 1911]|uniref:helix-turn-helix domain-containing protein n=1 Tax=unclassified Haladaptatus TaxID=2622732 RepID=UPI003753ECB4